MVKHEQAVARDLNDRKAFERISGGEDGARFNFETGLQLQLSNAVGVGFIVDKHAIEDLGYNYNNGTGGSRPNGKDGTILGVNVGIFWVGGSYKLNAIYNSTNKTFAKEHVISIGALGVLGGRNYLKWRWYF